jgi:hypothetical protein
MTQQEVEMKRQVRLWNSTHRNGSAEHLSDWLNLCGVCFLFSLLHLVHDDLCPIIQEVELRRLAVEEKLGLRKQVRVVGICICICICIC